jgi:menaquinone-specific isochorismate synthase
VSLTARTTNADGDPGPPAGSDLVAFESPRRQLWGCGVARLIDVPAPWTEHLDRVTDILNDIEAMGPEGGATEPEPGWGPVAFGALPFDRGRPARFVIPSVLHGRATEGRRWTTVVGDGSSPGSALDEPEGATAPTSVSIRSVRSPEDWCGSVVAATKRIIEGDLIKVVLAREIEAMFDRPLDPARLHGRLSELYPASLRFAFYGFVGATPELLVSRVGDIVRAQPMAGTMPRTGDPDADQRRAGELLASSKNREEHQITIDMVHDSLLPWCSYLDAEPQPSVVPAGPVQHLATVVEGRLSKPVPSVLELVAALHPTPAVGGWPRGPALALIDELEGADRGRYAGPVGWVDARGNGAFGVGIRSVQLDGARARLFAGVGVVADSDPAAELEESRAKAQALLGALVRL